MEMVVNAFFLVVIAIVINRGLTSIAENLSFLNAPSVSEQECHKAAVEAGIVEEAFLHPGLVRYSREQLDEANSQRALRDKIAREYPDDGENS